MNSVSAPEQVAGHDLERFAQSERTRARAAKSCRKGLGNQDPLCQRPSRSASGATTNIPELLCRRRFAGRKEWAPTVWWNPALGKKEGKFGSFCLDSKANKWYSRLFSFQ